MRPSLILGVLAIGVLLIAAWLLLPAWDFLAEPVAPAVRADVNRAIEATSESPEEQARLRLELAALEQEDAGRRGDLRNTIAALVAGGVAAWGAVAAWRQLQDNRRQGEAVRRETDEQLRLARNGQLTERFTRAVDQLGSNRLDVRVGGIHAMERIAHDSQTDHAAVIEVLAAFVRVHSLRLDPADYREPDGPAPATAMRNQPGELPLFKRAAHVQAALTVLGRMKRNHDSPGPDLSASELADADLRGANLARAKLPVADLSYAYLMDADLTGVDLTDAELTSANLRGADLSGADLSGAYFEGARLTSAKANALTRWPDGFDPVAAGVVFVDRDD